MLGAILFAIFFLLISSKGRGVALGLAGSLTQWIEANRPFSYLVLLIMAVSAVLAFILMVKWPATPEPENPLAQYKRESLDTE